MSEPPLFVPNAGLERQRKFDLKLRAEARQDGPSWSALPYFLAMLVGLYLLMNWSTITTPFWRPPAPALWEHFSGTLAHGYRGRPVLVLADDEFVSLQCAPGLDPAWKCGSGYQSLIERHAGEPVHLGVAVYRGLIGPQAVVAEARTLDGWVHLYSDLRLTNAEALEDLFEGSWVFGFALVFLIVRMAGRGADEQRTANE